MKSITITAIGVSVLAATLLVGMFALTNIQKVNAQMDGAGMSKPWR
jgi:hypothetical protein